MMEKNFSFVNWKCPSHMLRIHLTDLLGLSEGKGLQFFHPSLQCVMKIRIHSITKYETNMDSQNDNSNLLEDISGGG